MSKNIITCLCWVKKQKLKKVPDEFNDNINFQEMKFLEENIQSNSIIKENETVKSLTTKLENLNTNNQNINDKSLSKANDEVKMKQELEDIEDVPVFSSDFKNYYLNSKENKQGNNNIEEEDFEEVSEEDAEDYTIHPTDNLVLCATAQDDIANLEIYIYDENKQNLFVHHDILLSSYPLCMEYFGKTDLDGTKANFAIIGSFLPDIEIWNLDSLNSLEPDLILGDPNRESNTEFYKKSSNKKGKYGGLNPSDTPYHTDAVLGISLNPFEENILASGSADSKVILWDIRKTTPIRNYIEHSDKVQVVKFNKCEDNVLLSGGYDHTLRIFDIRTDKSEIKINVNSDIEAVDFSPLNKYRFLVSFENGVIEEYDILNPFKPLFSFKAHKKATTSIAYSPKLKDLFVSCSMDCHLKVWDSGSEVIQKYSEPNMLAEKFLKKTTGELFCCRFADDIDNTIAVGGSKGDLLIWQLEQCKTFCDKYNLKWIDAETPGMPDEVNNLAKKKLMGNRIKLRSNNNSKSIQNNKTNRKK